MAKFNRGILGGFQGKLGTVIGTRWRGINVMRAVPEKVSNPNTIKQRIQRERFKLIAELMKKARPMIELGFERTGRPTRSATNEAMSWNVKYGVTGEYPGQVLDFAQLRFAFGTLEGVGSQQVAANEGALTFNWTNNSGFMNAKGDDELFVILYNEDKKEFLNHYSVATREAGTAILTLPESHQGSEFHVWTFMHNSERNLSSTSVYLGKVTP